MPSCVGQYSWLRWLEPPANWSLALTRSKVDFSRISYILYIYCNFTLGNSNLPLTRNNFCFPSDYFYTILPSIARNMFCSARQVRNWVRNTELIYFKTTMAILCLQLFFFFNPIKIECPCLYINQALLLNSFFKISISHIYISSCPRSKVCMILAFPLRPLAYFRLFPKSLKTKHVKSVATLFLGACWSFCYFNFSSS